MWGAGGRGGKADKQAAGRQEASSPAREGQLHALGLNIEKQEGK